MNFESTDELRRYLTSASAGAPTHMAVMYRRMLAVMEQHLVLFPSTRRKGRIELTVKGKAYRRQTPRGGLGLAGR